MGRLKETAASVNLSVDLIKIDHKNIEVTILGAIQIQADTQTIVTAGTLISLPIFIERLNCLLIGKLIVSVELTIFSAKELLGPSLFVNIHGDFNCLALFAAATLGLAAQNKAMVVG